MRNWNALIYSCSMMLQQISKTSQSIKFYIWCDCSVPSSNRRFYFFVDKLNNIFHVWFKVFIISSNRKAAKRNKTLSSIFGLCVIYVFFNFINNLCQTTGLFIISRNKTVHWRYQINTFFFNQNTFRFPKHSLNFINYSFSLIFSIRIFPMYNLLTCSILWY